MAGKITGVSLGPGDPELVTLKAFCTLEEADVVYCPATVSTSGEEKSKSLEILKALPVDTQKIRCFTVPMMRNREAVNRKYDEVCRDMLVHWKAGKNVAVVAEGDACFYSSANYLFGRLLAAGCPVQMIAGVPAFIAAGASVGLHVVKQRERLLVIPGDVALQELENAVERKYTVVIMKVPLGEEVIRAFIQAHVQLSYVYFEQVGSAGEFYTTDVDVIVSRPFTYFSLLVIRPESKADVIKTSM